MPQRAAAFLAVGVTRFETVREQCWSKDDLPALGWRPRRHYDMRATFIRLAIDDGADPDIIETRVTHTRKARSAFDGYNRGLHWERTCTEVSKLLITRGSRNSAAEQPVAAGAAHDSVPFAAVMADTLTLGAARAAYYERNRFGADGGDALAWVPVQVFGLTLKIPNSDGRRGAVRFHDLHHVLTGYATDLRGEAEIGAWELASGCLRWPAATVLNLFALGVGFLLAPRRLVRAWTRGRRTRNLYREDGVDHLLSRRMDEMRAELGLAAAAPRPRTRDLAAVVSLALPMLAVMAAPLFAVLALLRALV